MRNIFPFGVVFKYTLIIVVLLGSSSVVYSQVYRTVPVTAKWAVENAKKYLEFKGYYDARLVCVEPGDWEIDNRDTVVVKHKPDSLHPNYYEWTGQYWWWHLYFITDSVRNSEMIWVEAALDSLAGWECSLKVTYRFLDYPIVNDIGIVDSMWIDSDSIAKLPWLLKIREWGVVFSPFRPVLYTGNYFDKVSGKDIPSAFWRFSRPMYKLEFTGTGQYYGESISSVHDSPELATNLIQPHPVRQMFSIKEDETIESVQLYSLLGEVQQRWDTVSPYQVLSVAGVPHGMYMLRYLINGRTYTFPILITQ
ncbi:MAG: hypothetical protein JNJ85_15580 [Candidatus Kapabacteria bacterium]|nr:hypothetical protein [Candidatus Kapabacteria bacterium]